MKTSLKNVTLTLTAHIDGAATVFDLALGAKAAQRRKAGAYVLKTTGDKESLCLTLARADGREMQVDHLEYSFRRPLGNFSQVILPNSGRTYMAKQAAIYLRSGVSRVMAPDDGHPFLALVEQTGEVSFSFGLVSWLKESSFRCVEPEISGRKAMLGGADNMTMKARLPSEGWTYGRRQTVREQIFIGGGYDSWFTALRRYTALCRRVWQVRYPSQPAALDPTWCTWTSWCSELMTEELILANARAAKDLGIGTVMLDDGWFGPGLDTDDQPLNIGDYYPDPKKLPDLPGLTRKLQALGLKVLLWWAPTCVAKTSKAYRQVKHLLVQHRRRRVVTPAGFCNLCPQSPEARAYLVAEARRMLEDYGADGYKVDLYNTLPETPCTAPHEHDVESMVEGLHLLMAATWGTIRSVRPRAIVELKQNYGNVIAAQYGTMVRAGDAAYDVDTTMHRCAYQQTYARVVHNDYLAWSVHEKPRDLAIMLIKQITGGVPTFSSDLTKMPAALLSVVRGWLAFYRAHLSVWKRPRRPQDAALNVWEMADADTAVVTVMLHGAEAKLPRRERVFLLNGTGRDRLYLVAEPARKCSITRFDYRHRQLGRRRLTVGPGTPLDVEPGGYLLIQNA